MAELIVVMAQLDPLEEDTPGNGERAIETVREAHIEHKADVVVLPARFLADRPAPDCAGQNALEARVTAARQRLAARMVRGVTVVLGYPGRRKGRWHDLLGVLRDGEWLGECCADSSLQFTQGSARLAILSAQDVPDSAIHRDTADILLVPCALAFHRHGPEARLASCAARARRAGRPLLQINRIGGQGERVFDGGSLAVTADGALTVRAPHWEVGLMPVRLVERDGHWMPQPGECAPPGEEMEHLYCALITGLRDYVNKRGFQGVVLALDDGLAAALSLAVAVDALGPARVRVVLPSSDAGAESARAQARLLGVRCITLDVAPMAQAATKALGVAFTEDGRDDAEERLQAHCRDALLQALARQGDLLVLATGSRRQMALGQHHENGDYGVLKYLDEARIQRLAQWRHAQEPAIPEELLAEAPVAKAMPSDDAALDAILAYHLDAGMNAEAMEEAGLAADTVQQALGRIDRHACRRRRALPGVCVAIGAEPHGAQGEAGSERRSM